MTTEDLMRLRTLYPCDIETLHLILYAGDWPLPDCLLDAAKVARYELWHQPQFEIPRLNRLKKTGWIVITDKRLWLTAAGLAAAPLWLDYTWAQQVKREIKIFFKRPLLKHHIQWRQRTNLWLRGDAIKTPSARWFDPVLQTKT